MTIEHNPDRYAELRKRHKNADEAQKASADFIEELKELRLKHGISDVVVIGSASFDVDGDGRRVGSSTLVMSLGDPRTTIRLVAQAFASMVRPVLAEAADLADIVGAEVVQRPALTTSGPESLPYAPTKTGA